RLPPILRARAFERAGHHEGLPGLLEDKAGQLYYQVPEDFLRWDALAPGPVSSTRRAHGTIARLTLNLYDDAVLLARQIISDEDVAPRIRAHVLGTAVHTLAGARRF